MTRRLDPVALATGSLFVAALSTSRVQIMCAACTYRTEVVSDYRTAEQVFQTEHGELETAS